MTNRPSPFRDAALRSARVDLYGVPLEAAPLSTRLLLVVLLALGSIVGAAALTIPLGHYVHFETEVHLDSGGQMRFCAPSYERSHLQVGQQVHVLHRAGQASPLALTATIRSIGIEEPVEPAEKCPPNVLVIAGANGPLTKWRQGPWLPGRDVVVVEIDQDSALKRLLRKNSWDSV